MNIIYVSCLCSNNKFINLFKKTKNKPGQQVQKYHRLIVEGLIENPDIKVKTITAVPLNKNGKKFVLKFDCERLNNIEYNYLPLINIPIIKNLLVFLGSFFYTFYLCLKNKDSVIICDVLNISVSAGALFAAKILNKKSVGIVTDLPVFLNKNSNSIIVKINNMLINRFSSYIFLTKYMNDLVNNHNRPYLIMEGLVDNKMKDVDNYPQNKHNKKICLYSGGLQKIYGIKYLTEAFIRANIKDCELHIYGNGDYEEELKQVAKENMNIKYFGVVLNEDVVREQIKATLLINPRPSNEDYTKYSFPSKNMEYMVSGTPVLTTRLPGMPEEYLKYLYIIDNENPDDLAKKLIEVLNKPNHELINLGKSAKEFVLNKKNNIYQASKIIEMVKKLDSGY